MSNSAIELQQAARLGAGGLSVGVGKTPTGDYMFTGSVPVELVFERLDGKPLTSEQARYLSNFFPNKVARDKMGIQLRLFRSKALAIKAAKAIGAEVRESILRQRSFGHKAVLKEGEKMESKLRNRSYLSEASGDEVEVNGKKGVWKRVANLNIFFPSDGSDPIGIPKPKDKKQAAKEVVKAKKKVKFFNRLFKHLSK